MIFECGKSPKKNWQWTILCLGLSLSPVPELAGMGGVMSWALVGMIFSWKSHEILLNQSSKLLKRSGFFLCLGQNTSDVQSRAWVGRMEPFLEPSNMKRSPMRSATGCCPCHNGEVPTVVFFEAHSMCQPHERWHLKWILSIFTRWIPNNSSIWRGFLHKLADFGKLPYHS